MKKITAILLVLAVALASVFAAVEIDGRGATEGQKVTVTGPSSVTIQYEVTNKFAPAFRILVGASSNFDDNGTVKIAENIDYIKEGNIVFKLIDRSYSNSDAREDFPKNGIKVSFTYPTFWYKGDDATAVRISGTNLSQTAETGTYYDRIVVDGKEVEVYYKPGVQKLAEATSPVELASFTLSWDDATNSLDAGLYNATVGIGYTAL